MVHGTYIPWHISWIHVNIYIWAWAAQVRDFGSLRKWHAGVCILVPYQQTSQGNHSMLDVKVASKNNKKRESSQRYTLEEGLERERKMMRPDALLMNRRNSRATYKSSWRCFDTRFHPIK